MQEKLKNKFYEDFGISDDKGGYYADIEIGTKCREIIEWIDENFISVAEIVSSQSEPLVDTHTKKFNEWLNTYFTLINDKCYRTVKYELYSLAQLEGKFKRAMNESPFISS